MIPELLNMCEAVYDSASIVGGPEGRDGASIYTLPTKEIVLAFRGTMVGTGLQAMLDWMNDFITILVTADGFPGRVHGGFLQSLNDLWTGIILELEEHGYKEGVLPWDKKLIITGHSKGGALAVLAGCRLAALDPQVITFAAPMVGNLTFNMGYPPNVSVTRYEGPDDLVPWLPLVGYKAVGRAITQDGLPWEMRHAHAHHLMSDLLDPLTRRRAWERVHAAHTLATGYRPWLESPTLPLAA